MKNRRIIRQAVAVLLIFIFWGNTSMIGADGLYETLAQTDGYSANILTRDMIPEVLPFQTVADAGHTRRLFEEETDLSSVVFRNSDNTNTLYVFNERIKYEDADGVVRDKSNGLKAGTDGSYSKLRQ